MTGYDVKLANEYAKERGKYVYTDKNLLSLIDSLDLKGKKILDFGCGDGYLSIKLAMKGVGKVVGIDSSPQMIHFANINKENSRLSNLEFIESDGKELPFKDNSFDIVLANYVLVHFQELERPLKEIFRVLRDRGDFVATINNANISDKLTKTPTPLLLGKKVKVFDYLRTDTYTKKVLKETNFNIIKYKRVNNPDAVIDHKFEHYEEISDFHCVLFWAKKD